MIIAILLVLSSAFPVIADSVRITVDPVSGAAEPFNKTIAQKVSEELEHLGYETAGAAPIRLTGKAVAISGAGGAKFQIAWTLTDASGRTLGSFTRAETAPYQVANAWEAFDSDTLKRLAKASALGVEQALDGTDEGSAALLSTSQPKAEKPKQPDKRDISVAAKPTITKVFISGVTGAPGDGNIALPNALALYFSQFDVELLSSKAPDAYLIEGNVKLKPKNAAQQIVSILWLLKTPGGREIARIAQENTVATGSLDPHWGKTAGEAAEGAADGLLSTMAATGQKPPAK